MRAGKVEGVKVKECSEVRGNRNGSHSIESKFFEESEEILNTHFGEWENKLTSGI